MKKVLILLIAVYSFALNILVLNSYSADLEWTEMQSDTIVKYLKSLNIKDKNIYVEFMDTKRFPPTKERDKNYFNYLIHKYKNISFDIIITTDDNALNFVRKHKNSHLFKKAKVFFQGVNNLTLSDILNKNNYAGIFEKKEPLLQLKLAKELNPNLKTVYVLSDTSVSGNKTIKQYKNTFKNIKGGINFVYIHSSNLNEILDKLKNYDKNSVLMALTFQGIKKDKDVLSPYLVEKLISKLYKNPILVHNGVWALGNSNVVGGVCNDAKTQSELNMKKVSEYLNGVPMKDIGFKLNNVSRLFINVRNIRKFGIDEKDIKVDHLPIEYVNKPTSFYELHKWQIWTAIITFIFIILFLVVLAKKNSELNHYSKEIENINKGLEEKIKEAVEENTRNLKILQQQSKLAAMGEMIGMIAHQWRQPLNALALNIQFLPEMIEDECDEKAVEKLEKFAQENMQTIKFMSQTIDDFRNFFKKDKEKTEFYIDKEINKVLDIQKPQLKSHNIELITELKPIKIVGYKNEFKQVILNLIANAKDAILKKRKNGVIKISDYETNNEVIVTIEDNGGGIDEEIIGKIFEPYFTTKETQGTGMGLYMSNEIIKRMGGKIEVENTKDGAKFIIRLKK